MFASNLDDMKTTLVQDAAAVLSAVRALARQEAFLDVELECADGAAVRANATLLCACSPAIAHLFLRGERNVDVTSHALDKIVALINAGSVQLQCEDERRDVLEAAKRLQICGLDLEDERETTEDKGAQEAGPDFVRRVENWRCISQADTEPTVDEDWTDSLKDFDDEEEDVEREKEEESEKEDNADDSDEKSDEQQKNEKTQEIRKMTTEDEMTINTQPVPLLHCETEEAEELNEKTQEIVEMAEEDEMAVNTQLVPLLPCDEVRCDSDVTKLNEKTQEITEMTTEDEMAVATQLVTLLPYDKDEEVPLRVACDDSGVESDLDVSAVDASRMDESHLLPLTPPASPLSSTGESLRSAHSSLKSRRRSSGRRFGLRSGYSLRKRAVLVMGIASKIWRCADCDFWQYYRNKVEKHQYFIHGLESHQ